MDESSLKNRNRILSKDSFDSLLAWLDPDSESAGMKYEQIRQTLINLFTWRSCSDAESLADETIVRVIKRMPELRAQYTGNPANYFYGVAKNILLEYEQRRKHAAPEDEMAGATDISDSQNVETSYHCLDQCMQKLSQENRELVLQYYEMKKQGNEKTRQQLAAELGISLNTLRLRVYRLRAALKECIERCMQKTT